MRARRLSRDYFLYAYERVIVNVKGLKPYAALCTPTLIAATAK